MQFPGVSQSLHTSSGYWSRLTRAQEPTGHTSPQLGLQRHNPWKPGLATVGVRTPYKSVPFFWELSFKHLSVYRGKTVTEWLVNPVENTVSGSLRNSKKRPKMSLDIELWWRKATVPPDFKFGRCQCYLNKGFEKWCQEHATWELIPNSVFFFFLIDVQLVYNFASVSGAQQSNSVLLQIIFHWGFPGGASSKKPACQCRRHKKYSFDPWVGKIPWRRAWQSTPVFLSEESQGQRSLVGYSPYSRIESNMTEVT